MASKWNTLESDPGVFVHLLDAFAPNCGLDVVELYDLDRTSFPDPTFALLFLFKWQKQSRSESSVDAAPGSLQSNIDSIAEGPIFFRQTIPNACGTIALLHCLFAMGEDVDLSPEVREFRDFAMHLDSETRGDALESSEIIRSTHNQFSSPAPFVSEKDGDDDDGDPDAFHFVAYVPHAGAVWELDGLRQQAHKLGAEEGGDWLQVAGRELQRRVASYATSEIRFNLLAITRACPDSVERHARYSVENQRRRWNAVPFLMACLQETAKRGQLQAMYEAGRKKLQESRQRASAEAIKRI